MRFAVTTLLLVVAAVSAAAQNVPTITLVANAEGENPVIAPNTWVEIKGQNLCKPGQTGFWQLTNNQLSTTTSGVSVTVNGKSAFVYYISPAQINILTPPDAMPGTVQVVVTNNAGTSAAFSVKAQSASPSFFVFNGGPYVAALHADYSLLGPSSLSVPGYTFTPAKPGETVLLYANGFGPTSQAIVSGSETQGGTLSPLPVVTIGGIPAQVQFAGLVYPGEFQFNVVIPSNAPSGDNALIATYNGFEAGPAAMITVQGSAALPTTVTYYVAPNGNDLWSGTLPAPNGTATDGPFATFDRARAFVQTISKTGLSQINVQFRGGNYYLPATEMFSSADSGAATMQIVYQNYPGETPVFSGGVRVQSWTNPSGNTWKTTLPASTQYFETLFYNGSRRLRPRLGGYLGAYYRILNTIYLNAPGPPAAAPDSGCQVYVSGSGWECFDRFQYTSTDPISKTWKNLAPSASNHCNQPAGNAAITGDIELLDFEQFSTSFLRVSCVDTANQIVYLTGATPQPQNNYTETGFIAGHRYLVENVEDALTQPGQWFLDRSATPWTLTYLANTGENPNNDTVVIPQLPIVLLASSLQYVTFRGLTFEHDNHTIPALGYDSTELEPTVASAVSFQDSQNITFDSGIVTQTSGNGIEVISCTGPQSPDWCVTTGANVITSNVIVQNSAFYDIGAAGIRVGEPGLPTDSDANVPQLITVANNVVEGYGRVIPAAFGIGSGMGHDNLFTHNDVYDGYHCAVSISQNLPNNTAPNGHGAFNNTISFNHVYNLLQGIMNDGGSIRIEGGNAAATSTGNKILNNKIHDVTDASIQDSDGYGGDGVYLDNSTGLVDVENNLVYRVSGNAFYTPHGPNALNEANTIKNNIGAFARQSMISANDPYVYGVPAQVGQMFVVTNNLFYFDRSTQSNPVFRVQGGCAYAAGVPFTSFQFFKSNMYWRTDGAFATDPKAFHVQPSAGTGPNAPCSNNSTWTFYTFAQWQQVQGEDLLSVVQNPGFANPGYPADDYSLPKGSPGVGFIVFDPNQAGRSNPILKPPAIPATFPTMNYNPATDY